MNAKLFSKQSESTIERKSCEAAKKLDWLVKKLSPQYEKGLPDRMFIKDGQVVFIEFKMPSKKPTKIQELCHNELRDHGALIFISTSIEDTLRILNMIETGVI